MPRHAFIHVDPSRISEIDPQHWRPVTCAQVLFHFGIVLVHWYRVCTQHDTPSPFAALGLGGCGCIPRDLK